MIIGKSFIVLCKKGINVTLYFIHTFLKLKISIEIL